jgi:isoamylase/glycogen operon protein
MQRYQTKKRAVEGIIEFKELVKSLHKAGIEVILDLVFNHTGEGNQYGRQVSWKGFATSEYYLTNSQGEYSNFSGCGNTLNCNNPVVQDMIIASLHHLVTEFHIDGFRFDLASILTRGREGFMLEEPPLIDRITQDPLLKNCKLIAEPWDAAGLHQVGSFYQVAWQGESRWLEWNDSFRSVVRRFIRGDLGLAGHFATKLCGSQDVYGIAGSPLNSINYITCHDGFTLRDLVSYNHKHNLTNGEENRDGSNHNESWNCGHEGHTTHSAILQLRERQMKNFLVALFFAQGIPMLQMGDEYGHTKQGNNNSWCHDNQQNWFLWDKLEEHPERSLFVKRLIQLRKQYNHLFRKEFLTQEEIDWHGVTPFLPDWSERSQLIAYSLKDKEHRNLYVAFNAAATPVELTLPPAHKDNEWSLVVDTAGNTPKICDSKVLLQSYSAIVLLQEAKAF